ncbi:MAG: hypothetical protein AAGJ78_04750 [Pseudomonadota bacterium]
MTNFFSKSQTVNVSQISADGWWLKNTTEHVSKGTALGDEFTQNIYTPSKEGMISRYDRTTNTWSVEIKDMTFEPYWNEHGCQYVIGEPDGDYPEWAIKEKPPEHDSKTQTVLYSEEKGWKVYDVLIGKPYFDKWGNEILVSDFNFELPEEHSFEKPPKPEDGYGIKLVEGKWEILVDLREKIAYAKDRDNQQLKDYQIEKLGDIPITHTLKQPGPYDSWQEDKQDWQYDIERHLPFKIEEEKAWRNDELGKVIDRIDQYEKDQQYPLELRTSPIESNEQFLRLLHDRKTLSDYPATKNFPFGDRPVLSGLAN